MTRQVLTLSIHTIELVEKLKQAPWFEHVGAPLEDDSVEAVDSWEQAMKLFLSCDWEDACLDARNRLSVTLCRDHRKRYQDWNKIVYAVNDRLKSVMERAARQAIAEHGLPEKFEEIFLNTIRGACVEVEYSDIILSAFFTQLARWYMAGHLPCGLTGKAPNTPSEELEQTTPPAPDITEVVKQAQQQLFDLEAEAPDPTLGGSRKLIVF